VARGFASLHAIPALTFHSVLFSRALSALDESPAHMSVSSAEARTLKGVCQAIAPGTDGSSVVELAFGVTATLPDRRVVRGRLEVMSTQRGRLVVGDETVPLPFRWDLAALRSNPAAQAILARYEQTWRDGFLVRAS
jgi:hypothetical protein